MINRERGFLSDGDGRELHLTEELRVKALNGEFSAFLLLGLHNLRHGFSELVDFLKELKKTRTMILTDAGDYSSLPSMAVPYILDIIDLTDIACFNEFELAKCSEFLGLKEKIGNVNEIMEMTSSVHEQLKNPMINVHLANYCIDLIDDRYYFLPALNPRKILIKTGLGDGYIAGKTLGLLQNGNKNKSNKNNEASAYGNLDALLKIETGEYPNFEELKSAEYSINKRGLDALSSLLKDEDLEEFMARGYIEH